MPNNQLPKKILVELKDNLKLIIIALQYALVFGYSDWFMIQ